MPKKPSKSAPLFEIRLRNLDHDVLVVKGDPSQASSVLLSGKIVLSVNEPIHIRRLSMRVYTTMRLNWVDVVETAKGTYPRPQKVEKRLFEHMWDHSETSQYLQHLFEQNTHMGLSSVSSSSSLMSLGFRSKSSTSLAQENKNSLLGVGNYEIPFSTVLPGSIPESVEGLPGASVVHRIEASLDRGKFHNALATKKHLRVVRTLTTDAVELSETVAVDNTWPKKVEYSLSVPSKAIAIGQAIPVTMTMVPLLKGLRLGNIRVELIEFYSYVGVIPPAHSGERVVAEKTVPQGEEEPLDKWEVETVLRLPASLSRCTQDCDITQHIKVRHKIKFNIGLINPDGHVSELRASLPVQFFISPFVSVRARHDTDKLEPDTADREPEEEDSDDDVLFHSTSQTSLNQLDNNQPTSNNSYTSMTGLMAPPLYEKHIYDRLWSDVSPVESPSNSEATSPRYSNRSSHVDLHSELAMSPIDPHRLSENLRLLSISRSENSSTPGTPGGGRATFNLDGDDYFARRSNPVQSNSMFLSDSASGLVSPAITSPTGLSRSPSSAGISKVPSYSQAMKSDGSEQVLAPVYEPPLPGSNINLDEVNRVFEENRGSSPSVKNMSRSSSSGSSPSISRESSLVNLAGFRRSPSTSGVNLAQKARTTQPSGSAADRSAALGSHGSSLSLHNLHWKKKKHEPSEPSGASGAR